MATDKALKVAAKELNEVLGIEPPINVKGSGDDLTKALKVAIKLITDDDEFTEVTQEVVDELKAAKKAAAPAPPAKKGKAAPVVEEDEEEEEEEEDEEEVIAPAKKGKKVPVVEEDDEDEDEEEVPAPKKGKVAPAPVKGKKVAVVEDDDDEDEDDEPVKPAKKAAKEEKVKAPKKTKEETFKGPGIIKTIVDLIEQSGKEGISIDDIHRKLIKMFPDRDPKSMLSTVKVQVPGRINKEKFPLKKLENGNWRKAPVKKA